ncbi:hypothetical protein M758_1G233700 [Ceratodon purpureus]|nr:hypothetical protein M758_1G233700 [Ceratodon purpureus]
MFCFFSCISRFLLYESAFCACIVQNIEVCVDVTNYDVFISPLLFI